jgi:hypothetical protein
MCQEKFEKQEILWSLLCTLQYFEFYQCHCTNLLYQQIPRGCFLRIWNQGHAMALKLL